MQLKYFKLESKILNRGKNMQIKNIRGLGNIINQNRKKFKEITTDIKNIYFVMLVIQIIQIIL